MRLACAIVLLVGCRVPETRTAVELEREAESRRMKAEQARAVVAAQERALPVPSGYEAARDPGTPLAGAAAGRAGYLLQTATELEEVARRIRRDAEAACVRVPPPVRTACPLGGEVAAVERIPRGVRLRPKDAVAPESLRVEIDCAMAQAKVDRPSDDAACPLLVRGASAKVVERGGVTVVEVTAPDEARAEEVRRRAERRAAPPP
jgi:hypothetical protein